MKSTVIIDLDRYEQTIRENERAKTIANLIASFKRSHGYIPSEAEDILFDVLNKEEPAETPEEEPEEADA